MNAPTAFPHNSQELDDALVASIRMAALVANTQVLMGRRQHDRFCVAPAEPGAVPRVVSLEQVAHEAVDALASWLFEPVSGQVRLLRAPSQLALGTTRLPTQLGRQEAMALPELLAAFAALPAPPNNQRLMLMLDAGLLFEEPTTPRAEDFTALRAIEHLARTAPRSHALLLRAPQSAAVPPTLLAHPKVRSIQLPTTSLDVRTAYAGLRSQALAEQCHAPVDAVARVVATATEDWNLDAVDSLIQSALRGPVSSLVDIEELARAIRVGTARSPWVGQQIREVVRNAEQTLQARVKGQPEAVKTVVRALRKACTGLSGAHEGRNTNLPRGTFLLSGATGTGKTEMAKALAQMIYGAEGVLIRFDCSELGAEHAMSRLIGAPPGYVGYERGGDLTKAVRARPNSVVLFDEVEKAHPSLWKLFLQILGDGHLTDGGGETADFSQTIIIFTSNLGIYEEQVDAHGRTHRVPRFDHQTPYAAVHATVLDAIRAYFVSKLGLPEVLGRLQERNIVVFDLLRDHAAVAAKFEGNVVDRCRRLHGTELSVAPELRQELVQRVASRPEALALGGRGLASDLDAMLVEPLADYLFDTVPAPARLHADWVAGEVHFNATP
jgi:ATP-dependent Clp protease ATP-binding subunit ClpB